LKVLIKKFDWNRKREFAKRESSFYWVQILKGISSNHVIYYADSLLTLQNKEKNLTSILIEFKMVKEWKSDKKK